MRIKKRERERERVTEEEKYKREQESTNSQERKKKESRRKMLNRFSRLGTLVQAQPPILVLPFQSSKPYSTHNLWVVVVVVVVGYNRLPSRLHTYFPHVERNSPRTFADLQARLYRAISRAWHSIHRILAESSRRILMEVLPSPSDPCNWTFYRYRWKEGRKRERERKKTERREKEKERDEGWGLKSLGRRARVPLFSPPPYRESD